MDHASGTGTGGERPGDDRAGVDPGSLDRRSGDPGGGSSRPGPRRRLPWLTLPVFSWAMYEFANTIFSLSIGTRYFNEWIVQDLGRPDWNLAAMSLGVTLALVLTMPGLGAVADQLGRRKPFVIAFTAMSVVATLALGGVAGATLALVIGGVAVFGYQSGMAHYDPMLADVAAEEHRGRVSGFGVGIGYVGSFTALVVLGLVVAAADGDKQAAFVPTAIMFAVFTIPLVLFVRDSRPVPRAEVPGFVPVVRRANGQLVRTLRRLRSYREVFRFLLGRFLYVDALAVVILYMTIYLDRLGTFTEMQKNLVLAVSIPAAIVGAFVAGPLVDRKGPKWVLTRIIAIFAATLVIEGVTGSSALIWVLGPIVGIGLGGTWTSDRVFMMRLTPPAERGEFFGVFHLVGKVSNAAGPAIWALTIYLLHDLSGWTILDASRAAMVVLALVALAGIAIIRGLDDSVREFPEDAAAVGQGR